MERLNSARWISLVIGILLIITGITFFKYPIESLMSISLLLAIMFIAIGVLRLIRYFTDDMFKTGSFLVISILDIILGLLIIFSQPLSALTLGMILAIWIMFTGVTEIAVSLDLKRFEVPRWWLGLISGIIGVILGFMMIRNPALSSIYIGMYVILYGITFISVFFGLTSLKNKMK